MSGQNEIPSVGQFKQNSRKALLPLFLYLILQDTSPAHPLRQPDFVRILKQPPYGISVERKAVARFLHMLAEDDLGICYDSLKGAWKI